jgi:hypothetical protein
MTDSEVEEVDTPPEPAQGLGLPPLTITVAAAASAAAGLVHATAAGTHTGDRQLVVLFALTAVAQLAWAAAALVRPTRLVLFIGIALNGAAALAWVLSRSFGLPIIDSLSQPEEVGVQDLIAAALGGLAAVGALLAVVNPVRRSAHAVPAILAGAAVFALAVPAMAVEHTHGASHDHGHGEDTTEDGHDHRTDADADREATREQRRQERRERREAEEEGEGEGHDHGDGSGGSETGSGPIISLDDPRVTPDQRSAAQSLIDTTTAAMAQYSDPASVEAAGYNSIGDSITGHEHFVNFGYLTDSVDLDPARVESIVFQVNPDGTKELVSAMYILGVGQTTADVPDIAGELTTWHDHQNLCWEGGRVVGILVNGSCTAGTFEATPPMLHVWMVPNECGPFAGLEGHGGDDCSHAHDAADSDETAAGD